MGDRKHAVEDQTLTLVDRTEHFAEHVGKESRRRYWTFWCPGCRELHRFEEGPRPDGRPGWTMSGPLSSPSFSPSLLYPDPGGGVKCHLFVRDGRIEYCPDSAHELRGKAVAAEPLPSWYMTRRD